MTSAAAVPGQAGSRRGRTVALGIFILAAFTLFIGLGVWQVQRLGWKLDLIRAVDERIHAAPVDAPGPGAWPAIDAANDAYRRLEARGHFSGEKPALVQAVTRLGPGWWVVSPFVTDHGFTVLVNRGFVPTEEAGDLPPAPSGDMSITGLLRISEPGGAFLRSNDPAADRWFSRDVAAIAEARGLDDVAPYFIDADASASPGPVGGLTVVTFRNHHLVYAITWFGLAAMLAGWTFILVRKQGRKR